MPCVSETPRILNHLVLCRPRPCPRPTGDGSTLRAGHPGHCEREDHQTLALFYAELDSSLFSNGTGHPSGGPWRQFHCTSCGGSFLETHGPLFHGKQAAVELIVRVLACLAEGLGIRATARVFEVDPNTVLHGLVEAAEHLRAFSAYCLCDLHVNQVQLDALYAVLREVKAGEIRDDEAVERLERSPYWVWTAMDPLWKAFHNGSYRRSIVMEG